MFVVDAAGMKSERSVANGAGNTQQAAKDDALSSTPDEAIRAALTRADPRRPHWAQ